MRLVNDESETEDLFIPCNNMDDHIFKLLNLVFCAKDKPDPLLTDELLDSLGY